MLIVGIVSVGVSIVCFVHLEGLARKLYSLELYSPHILTKDRADTDVAYVVDVKVTAMQMRTKMMLGDMLMRHYVSMLVMGGTGVILVVVALGKWRQHLHLGLIAKLLRAKLETERGALAGGAAGNTET